MAEADTSLALLAALDTRNIATIQSAMANYADAIQGVALQSAAFELVARMNEAKENEIDSLIAEMRQLATPASRTQRPQRRVSVSSMPRSRADKPAPRTVCSR